MTAKPSSTESQTNPLLPGFNFNVRLVAGLTPIERDGLLDFIIDRPDGMKGIIINMTVQGRGIVHDEETRTFCEPGDLLLFPAGVPHYYSRAPDCAEWHHRWVYFQPRAYWKEWLDWPQKIVRIGRLSLTDPAVREEIETLFKEIERTHYRGTALAENISVNLLERLLLRCAEENAIGERPPLDPRIRHACHLLSEHLTEDWSIARLARAVSLSPSRLEHLFREQVGTTVVRWREDQRLIRARQLLQITLSPISIVAASVGYDDQLYFSRIFRKRIGVSPSDFRKLSFSEVRTPPKNHDGTR